VVFEPRALVDHYEFGSEQKSGTSMEFCHRNRKRFRARHHQALRTEHLPAHPANLLFARHHSGLDRRLLVIDDRVPEISLGAGYPRTRALLNAAVTSGWSVTFYPLIFSEVDWVAAYAALSIDIEICEGRGQAGLEAFLLERSAYYDAILVSRPHNMSHFREAIRKHSPFLSATRIIYDAEALFARRSILKAPLEGRLITQEAAEAMIAREIALAEGVDAVTAVTEAEAQEFQSRQNIPVHVISHPTYPRWDAPGFESRSGFLFVGQLLGKDSPNYEGLTWFLRLVWPAIIEALADATLTIAGALPADNKELLVPGVRLLGRVEDLAPIYDQARVFIAPSRFAAGLPIKILEAAAAGLPVVGTGLMADQLGWQSGLEMATSDDPSGMARAAMTLHKDRAKWDKMRASAQHRLSLDYGETTFRERLRILLDGREP
jgi:glycosyltransferase involved in cell wall biosynthesis